jgi:N-acetylmuramoyl-L-alanine amidase CwlA
LTPSRYLCYESPDLPFTGRRPRSAHGSSCHAPTISAPSRSLHVERFKKATQENAKTQAQEAAQATEISPAEVIKSALPESEGTVTEGKKVRIRVRTVTKTYVGDFVIPPMRNRVSDVINEDQRLFINLTDVVVDEKERAEFVMLNKTLIESITQT